MYISKSISIHPFFVIAYHIRVTGSWSLSQLILAESKSYISFFTNDTVVLPMILKDVHYLMNFIM